MPSLFETMRPPEELTLLAVSQLPEDYLVFRDVFQDGGIAVGSESTWRLSSAATISAALRILKRTTCPAVICERDLPLGRSWKDLLIRMRGLARPPLLIVTSRHADEYLWAEALNLGAYDVLAKPFDRNEIVRVVSLALSWWRQSRVQTAKAYV